ncbi:hypothetical protein ABZX85_27725 [Streptomyces sp. NPDC004539]|uniref:hypothetical protein n=1 Tax=Streptomyces sp. NPDC004539 TaxID=3154280 RepID=UPI0033A44795
MSERRQWRSLGLVLGGFTVQPVTEPAELSSPEAESSVTEAAEAVAEMRDAGYEPRTSYEGPTYPWPSECLTCGALRRPSLRSVRRGARCRHRGRRTDVGARASPQSPTPAPDL